MRYHLGPEGVAWADPRLQRIGAVMGGAVSARAEVTDKNPPRLDRYDRWGHDISEVVPAVVPRVSARRARQRLQPTRRAREAAARGIDTTMLNAAHSYMLDQAEIGMACARHRRRHGGQPRPPVRARRHPRARAGEVRVRGVGGRDHPVAHRAHRGSDLAEIETTATPGNRAWRLNGFKWFASNANGQAWVVLAKPEGVSDNAGIATFLVLRVRRDGSRNGIRIRRLKDKLGTRAVASAEVELVDAEAFLLSGQGGGEAGAGDGKDSPHDGDDQRCPAGNRHDGPRLRSARPGRVALLRPRATHSASRWPSTR